MVIPLVAKPRKKLWVLCRVYKSLNRKVIDSVVLKHGLSNVDYRHKFVFWSDTRRAKWRAWKAISSATLQFIVNFDTFQCGVQLSHPFAKFSHGEFTTLNKMFYLCSSGKFTRRHKTDEPHVPTRTPCFASRRGISTYH